MIFLGCDNCFTWSDMTIGGEPIIDADVSASVQDLDGSELETFSLVYNEDTASDYVGCLLAAQTADLEECSDYVIIFTATVNTSTETRRETHTAIYKGYA